MFCVFLRLQGQDEAMEETRTDPPAEVTDVLIKRGFKVRLLWNVRK